MPTGVSDEKGWRRRWRRRRRRRWSRRWRRRGQKGWVYRPAKMNKLISLVSKKLDDLLEKHNGKEDEMSSRKRNRFLFVSNFGPTTPLMLIFAPSCNVGTQNTDNEPFFSVTRHSRSDESH